jgi:hypothetical protein
MPPDKFLRVPHLLLGMLAARILFGQKEVAAMKLSAVQK